MSLRSKSSLVCALAVAGGLSLTACNNKKKEMTQAPPPPPVVEPAPVVSAEPVPPVSIQPTTTIGPATYPAPTDYAPSGGGTYTIRKGDTLFSIAKRTYGSGNRWRDIVAANPGLVPEKLRVGQTITLP